MRTWIWLWRRHFLRFTASLSLQEKAIQKCSCQSLRSVAVYLQARNCQANFISQKKKANGCSRRDFWLIVLRFCACHSARTVLATVFIFALYFLYLLLLKHSKFQYVELAPSLLADSVKKCRTYQFPVTLNDPVGF